jgi:hypothetical protein
MLEIQIIWDLPDDPDGNYVHIVEGHDVTAEEVDEVLRDPNAVDAVSRCSGEAALFGWTSTGKYLFVSYELVLDDPRTVYPLTAYAVPPPGGEWS